jgi:hypothetical protein
MLNKADNLWADGKSDIKSIDDKPRSETKLYAFPDFEASYQKEGTGTQYYLSSTYEEPGCLQAGIEKTFGDKSVLDVYGFYRFMENQWENPYALHRSPTNAENFGMGVSYENIAATDIELSYKMTVLEIQNDLAGKLFKDIGRSGIAHTISLDYKLLRFLIPGITYELGDFSGSASSYNKFGGFIGTGYTVENLQLSAKFSAAETRFDAIHPLFGVKRDEKSYGISIAAVWEKPLGLKHFSTAVGFTANETDSNIAFFDSRERTAFISFRYIM